MQLPQFFISMLNKQYGEEITNKIINGYSVKRNTTFRVNTLKADVQDIKNVLDSNGIKYESVKWCKEAIIMKNTSEAELEKLDIYQEGKIYLQSLSSMLPPIILDPKPEMDILDMAAAPGGKTVQMAALTHNKANITACEMNKIRAEKLKFNVERQEATSVYVMVSDSRKIDDFFSFDSILLDSPCSGSGTLNLNDKNLDKIFTEKLIQKSTKSQLSLLKKAINILKPGHEMVYSTCSIIDLENENIVNKVLENGNIEVVPIDFENMENLPLLPVKIEGAICICPNELYEGFFVCKLRKKI